MTFRAGMIAVARRMIGRRPAGASAGKFPGGQSASSDGLVGLGQDRRPDRRRRPDRQGGGAPGRRVRHARSVLDAATRKPESEEREAGRTYVPLDALLRQSDFVSIHSPLNTATRHQIGARELGLMKKTAFLINTARGPIVDEAALVRALTKKQIAGRRPRRVRARTHGRQGVAQDAQRCADAAFPAAPPWRCARRWPTSWPIISPGFSRGQKTCRIASIRRCSRYDDWVTLREGGAPSIHADRG